MSVPQNSPERFRKSINRISKSYLWIGAISVLAGFIVLVLGIDSAYQTWSQFNAVGGNFLGNFLAANQSTNYNYTVLILLCALVITFGFVLLILGSIAIVMGYEKALGSPRAM